MKSGSWDPGDCIGAVGVHRVAARHSMCLVGSCEVTCRVVFSGGSLKDSNENQVSRDRFRSCSFVPLRMVLTGVAYV